MELTNDIRHNLKFIIQNVESLKKESNLDKLTVFVTQITEMFEADISKLPLRIRQIFCLAFADMGWNFDKKCVITAFWFTKENLISCLLRIIAEIENWSAPVNPTAAELDNLSAACSRIWTLDTHRLVPGRDYVINLQRGKTTVTDLSDSSKKSLFTSVEPYALDKPTFKAFMNLLDNFNASSRQEEIFTDEEKKEEITFLQLCLDTACMQYVHQYLIKQNKANPDRENFIRQLRKLWFGLYKGDDIAYNTSCGFEHIFLGEVDPVRGVVSGCHNWIHIYQQELAQNWNYYGFIESSSSYSVDTTGCGIATVQPCEKDQLITMQFEWLKAMKLVSSSFIGTSPEFELAIYTLCFYHENEVNTLDCGPYQITMTSKKIIMPDKTICISTCYPADARLEQNEHLCKFTLEEAQEDNKKKKKQAQSKTKK